MQHRRLPAAVLGWLVLCLGHAFGQTPAGPSVVLMPPLPAPGQIVRLVVVDPAPANRDVTLYLWRDGRSSSPAFSVRSPGVVSVAFRYPTFHFFAPEAGVYYGEYYDEPIPSYASNPKAEFRITVSATGLVSVVEYHNEALGRYFLTADADEIAKLDAGAISGWKRTGESFRALPPGTVAPFARPVCRYYGLPEAGIDGHFYSASADECAAVAAKWPGRWRLETSEAFLAVAPPYPFTCEPDPWQRVYRLYDDRNGPRHRYTVSYEIRSRMLAEGWIEEGAPLDGAYEPSYAMCVPTGR